MGMHRQMHPYQGCVSVNAQNASVVLLYASSNAPLSRMGLRERPECKRGAHLCIVTCTPIKDACAWTPKMQARCSFTHRQMHPYPGCVSLNAQNASVLLIYAS